MAAVDLCADKFAVLRELDLKDLCQRCFGDELKPAVGAEIAQTIFDQTVFVDLHSAHHVGAVAEDEIGAGVNHGVGKKRKIAALFAGKNFGFADDMLMIG